MTLLWFIFSLHNSPVFHLFCSWQLTRQQSASRKSRMRPLIWYAFSTISVFALCSSFLLLNLIKFWFFCLRFIDYPFPFTSHTERSWDFSIVLAKCSAYTPPPHSNNCSALFCFFFFESSFFLSFFLILSFWGSVHLWIWGWIPLCHFTFTMFFSFQNMLNLTRQFF